MNQPVIIGDYEVREANVGAVPNFFELMQKPVSEITEALVKASVYKDGQLVGNAIGDIPLNVMIKLMSAVIAANGLADSGKE